MTLIHKYHLRIIFFSLKSVKGQKTKIKISSEIQKVEYVQGRDDYYYCAPERLTDDLAMINLNFV